MKACKIIGGIISLVGIGIAIAGAAQREAWGAGGAGLALIGRIISEKFPDWFDLY